jgi:hypothetical protein
MRAERFVSPSCYGAPDWTYETSEHSLMTEPPSRILLANFLDSFADGHSDIADWQADMATHYDDRTAETERPALADELARVAGTMGRDAGVRIA